MQIITRKEAKAKGLTKYFNGKPCPHGHVAQRGTAHGGCLECQREARRAKQKAKGLKPYVPDNFRQRLMAQQPELTRWEYVPVYYTGKPCKRGHIAWRVGKDGVCVACRTETQIKRRDHLRYLRQEDQDQRRAKAQARHGREIVYRYEAKELGQRTYFTGEECANGHISERLTVSGQCVSCLEMYYTRDKARYVARSAKRHKRIRQACPSWACDDAILTKYKERERMTALTGVLHHVDHEIPLQGHNVCGLHVAANLRVILARDNLSKHNKWETA